MSQPTHEVLNQSEALAGHNLFLGNRPLRDALARLAPTLDTRHLVALGAELGSAELQSHARLAHNHPPLLHTHDRVGRRADVVEFHPSWHVLMDRALHHGLAGRPWSLGEGAHVERAAAFMLFTELDAAVLCPVSMSYAAAPALRANRALQATWGGKLAGTAYDARFVPMQHKTTVTLGMGMTEKQGGSDVRSNTTRAEPDGADAWGSRWRLTGHKWFFSAPMSDAFLVLAQTPAGLSCFFLPRWVPGDDGSTLNAIHIQRLKHKLGNHANASSEVEFHGATAWLLGEPGRGVAQILAMGALTRLDCALGSAGLMRQALSLALHHSLQRRAFGKRLIELPLMRNVLADLALESEAATVLAMRLAAAVDLTELEPDPHEQIMRRLLTPVAKFWICKRGSHFVQEAMECLGGNGYVEAGGEGLMARIYREVPLNSIWEGAGNIMALDLLRALRGPEVAAALEHETSPARGAHPAFDQHVFRVMLQVDGVVPEGQGRRLARDVALLMQAALLHQCAPPAVFAAFCDTRLAGASDAFGQLREGHDLGTLIHRALPQDN